MTPRSVEAFKRTGVLPQEILYPTLQMFTDPMDKSPEIAQIKLQAAIDARKNLMKLLVSEYQTIQHLEREGKWHPEEQLQRSTMSKINNA
jgi:hypothetical protein